MELDLSPIGRRKGEGLFVFSSWLVEKSVEKPGNHRYLRPMIEELSVRPMNNGVMAASWVLKPGPEGEIRPEIILLSIFNLPQQAILGLSVIRSLCLRQVVPAPDHNEFI